MANTNNQQVADELVEKIKRFEQIFIDDFIKAVQLKTPVRTGALQAGWYYNKVQDGFEVENHMDYAIYVECGTEHMAPRAMLQLTTLEIPTIAEEARYKAGLV